MVEHDVLQRGRLMRHAAGQRAAQDQRLGSKAAGAQAHNRRRVDAAQLRLRRLGQHIAVQQIILGFRQQKPSLV